MKSYTMPGNTHGIEEWKLEYWKTLFEMEAVLNFNMILTNQAQYDTSFTSAFGPLIQHTLMNPLIYKSLSIIDTSRVTKRPNVPRREKLVSEISDTGKETLCWAQLEAESRFCGNDYEVLFGDPIVKSCHDIITSKLSICTIRIQQK